METSRLREFLFVRLLALACAGGSCLAYAAVPENGAEVLQAKYATLGEQLRHNAFQRPLTLTSIESDSNIRGDIYALLDYPIASLGESLDSAVNWCDAMVLHINTKECRASADRYGSTLAMRIGRKSDDALEDTYRVEFAFRVIAATPEYQAVRMRAETGPLGTSDYRILLEAVPVEGGRTFLHFSYSYSFGLAARLAMQAYLATLGSGKVGFTVVGKQADGQADYIGGVRGVVERNTMRYFLAIDAYLAGLAAPPDARREKRLQAWFSSTERYPRQLREVSRSAYLETKRGDYLRRQTSLDVPLGTAMAR